MSTAFNMARQSSDTAPEEIHRLLEIFAKSPFRAKESDRQSEGILKRCLDLIGKDYQFSIIGNTNGDLCGTYPTKVALLEYEKSDIDGHQTDSHSVQSLYDLRKINDILKQARRARCRARCVVPVILFEGKHICRSATLSSGPEIYGRSGFEFLFSNQESGRNAPEASTSQDPQSDWQLFDRVRGQDIQLLKTLNVGYICDLMVEKKKVKFLMNVTSSEKVDKEQRYSSFDIFSVPYPGCEFFREWKDSGYETDRLLFDWSQDYVDALLEIPQIPLIRTLPIDWSRYKAWDLLTLTRNYIKLLLHLIEKGQQGVLVHCISGWDRTPMFVSLLRLSLWADGLIHKSLSSAEVLYLTIAYDWYLFGHNLTDRLQKGEEIMYFCFHFLKFISSEEFSLKSRRKDSRTSDTEGPVDGILIDIDGPSPLPRRGSSNSLSSSGSYAPDSDITGHKELLMNGSVHLNTQRLHPQQEFSAHYSSPGSSSSPMAVPNHVKTVHDFAQSPVSGSWQIVTESESYGGVSFSQGSAFEYASFPEQYLNSRRSSQTSSCSEATEHESSVRWQRLNEVWRLFSNAYTNKITLRYGMSSTGLGTLLDSFAGKIGIRNAPV